MCSSSGAMSRKRGLTRDIILGVKSAWIAKKCSACEQGAFGRVQLVAVRVAVNGTT